MKVLFIGLGSIGQRHLRNLRTIVGDSVDVIAFRSKNQSPVLDEQQRVVENSDLVQQYQIKEFDDLDQALADKPDITFITNPSCYHIDVALKAAQLGCHLFIEKTPFCCHRSNRPIDRFSPPKKTHGNSRISIPFSSRPHAS